MVPKSNNPLEQRLIDGMRFRHGSRQTEEGYVSWCWRFVLWNKESAEKATARGFFLNRA